MVLHWVLPRNADSHGWPSQVSLMPKLEAEGFWEDAKAKVSGKMKAGPHVLQWTPEMESNGKQGGYLVPVPLLSGAPARPSANTGPFLRHLLRGCSGEAFSCCPNGSGTPVFCTHSPECGAFPTLRSAGWLLYHIHPFTEPGWCPV